MNTDSIKQYKGIVVSHTHWDRAWYWPYEQFRIRLVQVVDQVMDILMSDPDYKSFTLDGQTVVLEDYLEIKPERKADLERLIGSGRLLIGPWYILPDEFLVSGESLIRNLMLGHKVAKQFGNIMKEGYVPDPFGHIGQLPQILQGFGLRSFIFMRGMDKNVEELGSEFWWAAPDGSKVLAVYQRDNYGNLACWGFPYEFGDYRYDGPNNNVAVENLKKTFDSIRKYANTPYLLFNNGIDHLPPQPEVPKLIEHANRNFDDLKLFHGTYPEFVDAVLNTGTSMLKSYTGELIGKYHHLILLSVYSTRMYLKTANFFSQNLLERYAEPIAALTATEAKQDFTPFIWQGWRELLKNHPHDDICGCGVDEIHRDNVQRFDHVQQIGQYVREEAFQVLARYIDTALQEGRPVIVYNPLNWSRTEVVSLTILFPKEGKSRKAFSLFDSRGERIPFVVRSSAPMYRMEILKSGEYDVVEVDAAVTVPSCGYTTIYVREKKSPAAVRKVSSTSRSMENEFLKVSIQPNGTLSVKDKQNKQTYNDLLIFEDTEDTGDEYTYSWAERTKTITTKKSKPTITVTERSPLRITAEIIHTVTVPASLDKNRKKRSTEKAVIRIITRVTLLAHSRRLDIKTTVVNTAKDHRLRVHFPTNIAAPSSYAGGHFTVVERPAVTEKIPTAKNRFEYYSTRHNQDFISIHDDRKGLTIANKGLPEYEAIRGSRGTTVALTLLRSVGQLSRNDFITRHMQAGPQLPTPEAQCIGSYDFEYSVIPHAGDWLHAQSYIDVFNFTSPIHHWNVQRHAGHLPLEQSTLSLDSKELIVSAIKRSEDKSGIIVRLFNIGTQEVKTRITTYRAVQRVDIVNLNEELQNSIAPDGPASFPVSVPGNKILSLKLTFA
jgi:mannosylglycerate hydrolase